MATKLSTSFGYGGHLENDEGPYTISSLMTSVVFVTFPLILLKKPASIILLDWYRFVTNKFRLCSTFLIKQQFFPKFNLQFLFNTFMGNTLTGTFFSVCRCS